MGELKYKNKRNLNFPQQEISIQKLYKYQFKMDQIP